jgi:hypothetical protein
MSALNNSLLLGQEGGGGYAISRSLRFNSSDSAYLSRTPASAGNRKTWTLSYWIKRSKLGTAQIVWGAGSGFWAGGDQNQMLFLANDTLQVFDYTSSGAYVYDLTTVRVFRDTSAWYHIVLAIDTTQATTANRVRLYVNGVQETLTVATNAALNADTKVNNTVAHYVGGATVYYCDSYFSDIHFIDGQALTPTSFGEFDTNGIWQPKQYTGTYGTNGFKLNFSDNSAATATTLGKDSSGNGNNWTPNNLSVTAGAGNDSLIDVPVNGTQTDTGAGGEVRGNYATYNPLFKAANSTYSNGNLEHLAATSAGVYESGISTIGVNSGKWYAEFTVAVIGNDAIVGITTQPYTILNSWPGGQAGSIGYEAVLGRFYKDGVNGQTVSTYTTNDVIRVALDLDNGGIWFSKNGTWQGTGSPNPATNTSPAYTGLTGTHFFASGTGGSGRIIANFGQRPFAYTAPSGFKALCTANLPTPTIVKPSTVMDTLLWTGNSATRTLTGLNFDPDLIWVKIRSDAKNHVIQDSIRGFTTAKKLSSSGNFIEGDASNLPDWAGYISGTSSTGFSLDKSGTGADDWVHVNKSGNTYVGWAWDAGSSTVTNTAGTISAQVRANPSAGFSIATATYFGGTVGHGLGVAPAMVIAKQRDVAPNNWAVYHKDAIAAGTVANNSYLVLNGTSAVINAGSNIWNVTSTTISSNASLSDNGVYYSFAAVAGYSAFGSYTGNGNADGPFVYTGFRPRWLLLRSTSGARDWIIKDALRSTTYNPADGNLYANQTFSEDTTASVYVDILSNGFKLRGTYASINASGETFIYAAFAESPFALNARAR